ncbi:MFS transporter [Fulvivirga sediminis]|uniref:MFS transporter n=2 Tax=Fulvivirga sediminis TaxID=2803949 RepID=A0A937F4R4_9BACT|nr:MFS transporter [Fulvivirga sediminis]
MKGVSITSKKPKLSFWQIWNMSFGFLGIQFGFALQNANTSRIFETLGADTENLAFYWLAAPVTGLVVQPIIGYYSDRTWHPTWGRRRPYFTIGALLATAALCIMPNSPALWVAIGTLWIMDGSINISMEPFRAFVGDMLPDEQRTQGFAMQSFFIGIGAVVASILPWVFSHWLGVSNQAEEGQIPDSVKWSFYIGAFAFISAVMWTVFTTKEYPPEDANTTDQVDAELINNNTTAPANYVKIGLSLLFITIALCSWFYMANLNPQLYVLCGVIGFFAIAYVVAGLLMINNSPTNGFIQIVQDFQHMPKTMVQLAYVQFFSWFGLFTMWIYTNSAVTSHIFNSSDPTSAAYNEGADWVSFLFSWYNGVAAILALIIPYISKALSRRHTHLIALCCGGLGLISFYFTTNHYMLLVSMAGVGFAWASILSVPYSMLSSSLPAKKMGYYMGIFNFFIVIPQIIAASLLGFLITTFFDSEFIFALILGGCSLILAGVLCLFVNEEKQNIP